MPPFRRFALPLLVSGLLAAACGGGRSPAGSGDADAASGRPAQNATQAALLPTDAYALPNLDFAGYQQLLGQLKGTPVLVNVWASWCGPCRSEASDLAAASRAYGDTVQFLGVDILDARPSAVGFMKEFGWAYPSVFDVRGEIRDRLGFIGQPVTLFYGADGSLDFTWQGPISPRMLTVHLDALVAQLQRA